MIAQGIHDYNDDSVEAMVRYVPFLDGPGGNQVLTDSQGRTYVQGAVASNTTISAGDYRVLQHWLVQPWATLTIEPGASLAFSGGTSLDVKGNLLVQGVDGNEVVFTSVSATPSAGAWQGIRFLNSGGGDQIEHAVIEYAQYGIYCEYNSDPVIKYCRITDNNYGIYNYYRYSSDGTPNPVVNYCEIFSNVQYNYYNYSRYNYDWSSTTLNAKYNWWGVVPWDAIQDTIWAYEDDSKEARVNVNGFGFAFSPNGDGNKDSVLFVYDYEAPVWTVVIRDASDQIIRTLQSQEPFQYVEWDGTDEFGQPVADGTYTAEIYAEEDGIEVFSTTAEILLDTTFPSVAVISSPVDGEEVFAVVPVFGDIQDSEGIYDYTLEFGQGSSPTDWTEFWSGSTLPPSGYLGKWDTKPTPNTVTYPSGLYTIRLTVWDFGWNMVQDTVPVNLSNLHISNVSRSPSTIDISNGQTADINFTISLPAEVTLKIYPEWEGTNGQLVKAVTENFVSAGSHSISWDGSDNGGLFVPDEAYIYVLEAVDPGNPSRTDTYSPTGGHDNGSAIGSVDGYYNVYRNDFWNMVFHNASASRVSMQVIPASSDSFYVFDDVPYEAGDWLIIWDGRDPQGNIITGSVNIDSGIPPKLRPNYIITKGFDPDVAGAAGRIGIKSDPYIATICYGQFFRLLYNISGDCQVTIKVLPPGINSPDAPEAMEVLSNEPQEAGDHEVTWDAIDPLDPNDKRMLINEDGLYTFTIEAINPQTGGTTLKRGIINLYQ